MSGQVRTPEDRAQLLLRMRRRTASRALRRMNMLRLLGDGWVAERVAEILFIDVETVREHRRL
jgi:DNA-binding CsgD family transcriptional regulator